MRYVVENGEKNLRSDHPFVAIDFNWKTGEAFVSSKTSQVQKVWCQIDKLVEKAKQWSTTSKNGPNKSKIIGNKKKDKKQEKKTAQIKGGKKMKR